MVALVDFLTKADQYGGLEEANLAYLLSGMPLDMQKRTIGQMASMRWPNIRLPEVKLPELQTPQIQGPSLPQINLPQLEGQLQPNIQGPSLPAPTLPQITMPTIQAPALPTPNIQTPNLPGLPTVTTPSLPTPNLPSLPTITTPPISAPNLPSLPMPNLPSLPTVITPDIPSISTPSLPEIPPIEIGDLPTVNLPGLPSIDLSQIPTEELGDWSEVLSDVKESMKYVNGKWLYQPSAKQTAEIGISLSDVLGKSPVDVISEIGNIAGNILKPIAGVVGNIGEFLANPLVGMAGFIFNEIGRYQKISDFWKSWHKAQDVVKDSYGKDFQVTMESYFSNAIPGEKYGTNPAFYTAGYANHLDKIITDINKPITGLGELSPTFFNSKNIINDYFILKDRMGDAKMAKAYGDLPTYLNSEINRAKGKRNTFEDAIQDPGFKQKWLAQQGGEISIPTPVDTPPPPLGILQPLTPTQPGILSTVTTPTYTPPPKLGLTSLGTVT